MAIPSIAMIPSGYKASKLYSVLPTDGGGDLDVVRATTATRVNSDGLIENVLSNVPRLDYTNGGCPSLLVEPQRTNLALRSQEFDNVGFWALSNSASISVNSDVAPDGTTTADRLIAGANFSQVQGAIVGTIGLAYTGSIYIKRISGSGVVNLRVTENADIPITVTNEWTRVSATVTSTTTTVRIGVKLNTIGDEVAIWGAQLEEGSNATSYIPTVASTVTRNADVISKTGISDLIGQTEGTLFIDFALLNIENFIMDFRITDGVGNSVNIFNVGLKPNISLGSGGSTTFLTNATDNMVLGVSGKIAVAYKNNDFAVYQNGVQKFTLLSGNAPLVLNQLVISGGTKNYKIYSAQIFKTRLSNTELATLTTL